MKNSVTLEPRVGRMAVAAGEKYHFIGAGGIGMSGLVKIVLSKEGIVSGSDQTQSPVTDKLNQTGAAISIGHTADNLPESVDTIVISAAVRQDNPELQLARSRGCRIYKYAQMLGILMDGFDGVAIAGTHGKSTTGGWLCYLLKKAGIDVNFVIGADISQLGTNSGTGDSDIFIAEACEYDRSFWNLRPKVAVILNVEPDHLDIYKTEENVVNAFEHFAMGIRDAGSLITSGTDPNVKKILKSLKERQKRIDIELFGMDESFDYYPGNIELKSGFYSFDVFYRGEKMGRANLNVPGRHNILNALAVVAAAVRCGADGRGAVELLGSFTGMDRRLMDRGTFGGITIVDDYAHHPTEIQASLSAIKDRYNGRKLWCVYQPHQYSRTKFLLDDFAKSFNLADITIVPEIYFVRDEQATKKVVNAEILVERIRRNGATALFIDGFKNTCEYLKKNVKSGDVVVIMGAGDIWKVADEYIRWIRGDS
jgi:UDP-N-acetylmuramate--alanine ligase